MEKPIGSVAGRRLRGDWMFSLQSCLMCSGGKGTVRLISKIMPVTSCGMVPIHLDFVISPLCGRMNLGDGREVWMMLLTFRSL